LEGVRCRLTAARQPHGLVRGRGDRILARGAPHHAGRSARLLRPGGLDRATLRAAFRLALRQTEGLIGSILRLLGLDIDELLPWHHDALAA
jgi:hypothetical protein